MLPSLFVLLTTFSGQNQKEQAPKLLLTNDLFVGVFGKEKFYAPFKKQPQKPVQPVTANYRKDDVFVVWDSRGLSMRRGSKIVNSRLESLATDGRWFDRMQIAKNQLLLDYGGYNSSASRLIAHRRFDNKVFMLMRWESPQGTSWFDGLVRIDLNSKNLTAEPIARFSNVVLPRTANTLPIVANEMLVIETTNTEWGISRVQLKNGSVKRKKMGSNLEDILIGNGPTAGFIEETNDGSHLIGWIDLPTLMRSNIYETHGEIRPLDSVSPWVGILRDDSGQFAFSLETGAKLKIGLDKKMARMGQYVVVWSGDNKPVSAELYESTRWRKLAEWKAPTLVSKPIKRP